MQNEVTERVYEQLKTMWRLMYGDRTKLIFSANGSAFASSEQSAEIWLMDEDGNKEERLGWERRPAGSLSTRFYIDGPIPEEHLRNYVQASH